MKSESDKANSRVVIMAIGAALIGFIVGLVGGILTTDSAGSAEMDKIGNLFAGVIVMPTLGSLVGGAIGLALGWIILWA